jgi:hypothetical protein
MPMALGANSVFRVTEVRTVPEYMAAIRRPLFVMGVAPVVLISASVFFSIWPWKRAAEHILILALFGTIVSYLCLRGFQKIPGPRHQPSNRACRYRQADNDRRHARRMTQRLTLDLRRLPQKQQSSHGCHDRHMNLRFSRQKRTGEQRDRCGGIQKRT